MPIRPYSSLVIMGMIALGFYALLLEGGGLIGYLKARSKPSLIAGLVSGFIAMLSLILIFLGWVVPGFLISFALALMMFITFAIRYRKTGKIMPSGLLAGVSLFMVVLLGVIVLQNR